MQNANTKTSFHSRFSKFIKNNYALILLILTGLTIRIFFAQADPFLHNWDERFHALVARNMMDEPFIPMLKTTTLLSYDDLNAWCCNHIWLHKQPLFMWQMALSMKIFGVSELSMRLPSVLMGTIMILFLFRITLLLTGNKTTALIAATLLCFSHFHLILIAGIKNIDHNDVAFGFYILASFWAYIEYTKSRRWGWVVLIGLFAGCAILNKWLTGLAVFFAWGICLLSGPKEKNRKELIRFIVALTVCGIVFIPWQIYIFKAFPKEAGYEAAYNLKHLFEAVEGHKGSIFFYLRKLPMYFGSYLWMGIFPGIILAFLNKNINKKILLSLILTILFIFSFFSFVAKTKMDTYCFMIAPICMIFIAISLHSLYIMSSRKYIFITLYLSAIVLSLNLREINDYFSVNNQKRNRKIYNTLLYKNLKTYIPDHVKIVMGINSLEDVEVMFYNKDITANHWWITKEDLERLAAQQIPIATFKNRGSYIIPDYILNYPYLYIINEELK